MAEHEGPWMAYYCRTDDGTLLRPGDEVDVFNSRLMAGRFDDAAIDLAFTRLKRWKAYPNDPQGSRPVIVVHCGRLHVVMARSLTNVRPQPAIVVVDERPRPTKQKALF